MSGVAFLSLLVIALSICVIALTNHVLNTPAPAVHVFCDKHWMGNLVYWTTSGGLQVIPHGCGLA